MWELLRKKGEDREYHTRIQHPGFGYSSPIDIFVETSYEDVQAITYWGPDWRVPGFITHTGFRFQNDWRFRPEVSLLSQPDPERLSDDEILYWIPPINGESLPYFRELAQTEPTIRESLAKCVGAVSGLLHRLPGHSLGQYTIESLSGRVLYGYDLGKMAEDYILEN